MLSEQHHRIRREKRVGIGYDIIGIDAVLAEIHFWKGAGSYLWYPGTLGKVLPAKLPPSKIPSLPLPHSLLRHTPSVTLVDIINRNIFFPVSKV